MSSSDEDGSSKYEFVILKPAGNDTALVSTVIRDLKKRKAIADAIQAKFLNVEQVGFINDDISNAELLMTGGEFCGNATRSVAFHILSEKPGKLKIKSSGVKNKLTAGVTENGEGFSQMPVYSDPSCVKLISKNEYLVTLEGITHLVDFNAQQIKGLTEKEIKLKARRTMAKLGIDQTEACGVIYAEETKNGWAIYPVVFVKKADTLYFETACGSGTTALGLVIALKNNSSIRETSVMQPSGLAIKVSVEFNGSNFGTVLIQSPIQKLEKGIIKLGNEIEIKLLPKTLENDNKIPAQQAWA